MTPRTIVSLASLATFLLAAACGGGGTSGTKVDEIAAGADAKCEASTAALKAEGDNMLPGRACGTCHRAGGQAPDADTRWTVSGTVYNSLTSACNSGGVAGVTVEIFEGASTTAKVTLTTNSAGNFFTASAVNFANGIRAKITKDGKSQQMSGAVPNGNCASCHQPQGAAPGRISLTYP